MTTLESWAVWRRLDLPGHDACRLFRRPEGWELRGTAIFFDDVPAVVDYVVMCTDRWLARSASVSGWFGDSAVSLDIACDHDGVWTLNSLPVSGLSGCHDVDLWFTPATNLVQIRRLGLAVGESGDAPAAWLDLSAGTLDRLDQRYERRGETAYWYEAPRFDYAAMLDVRADGFVRSYPRLWEMES